MTEAPAVGPDLFGWSPDTSVAGAGWGDLSTEVQDAALQWSVSVLWALSGRQFELHAHRVAPYIAPRQPSAYAERTRGLGLGVNYRAGYARQSVGCSTRAFRAPWPVHAVTQVQLDGVTLDPTDWHLDPDGTLVRTDGAGWPIGQDVFAPRWLVDYVIGIEPSAGANAAAGRYAGEFARAFKGAACNLPVRARSIARTGLTIELPDPAELTENGRTGSPQVDAWLASVNPGGLAEGPTVHSPDLAVHRFLT